MRRAGIVAFAVLAATLMLTAPPAQAATINYRIASSSSELQNGTLSNARVDTERDTVRPGTYDDTLEHRYRFESGTTDVVGSDDLSGSSSAATGIAGGGRALDSGDTLSFSDSHAGEYAVSLWVKPSSEGLIYDDSHVEIGYFNGGLSVSEAGGDELVSLGSISAGEWTQISVHVDSGGQGSSVQATAFRDGQFEGTISQLGYLGETPTLGADNFAGTVDELRVYHGGTPGEMARLGSAPEAPAGGDPGLAERWAFDAGVDSVAYGDDGDDAALQNGATWASGPSGQALSLDGTDDHATAAHSSADLTGDDSWTISARVRWDGGNADEVQNVVHLGAYEVRLIRNSNGLWQAYIFHDDGNVAVSQEIDNAEGRWLHLSVRYADGELSLWEDGTKADSLSTTVVPRDSPADNGIGARASDDARHFSGRIDEARIYERGLSDAEIGYLADHPGAELARGDYQGQARSVDASTGYTDFRSLQNAEATVTWQGYDGSSWVDITTNTYTTAGNKSVSLPEGDYEQYRPDVSLEPTHPYYRAELDAAGVSFAGSAPTLSDPQPTGTITSFDGDLEINVSDPDFADSEGDEVTVTASNSDGQIGSTTVTSNGTATIPYNALAGTNDISWSAADSYGESGGASQQFTVPENLYIRPESNTSALVDGSSVSIEVRFYSGEQIYTRTTTNGIVSLAGLPADSRFAVVVSAEGYYRRRVIIDSLYEQQTVYLLNESKPAVEKQFVLNDVSGNFPAQSTRIYIQRSINDSTDYRTVAADYFGATSAFSTFLQTDQRYRIIIENDQGDRRTLGSYTPVSAGVEPLKIEGVGLYEDSQAGYIANASARRLDTGQRQVVVRYRDPANATSDYSVRVYERGNESNVTYSEQVSGPVENYSAYVDVENSTNYVVNWSATRGGQQVGGARPVGGADLGLRIPLPAQWLGTIGLTIIVFVGSLAGERYATHLALAVVAFAGVLMYLAVVDIFLPLWWAGLLIAAGGHLAQRRPAA
jgi:hypothetical protein